MNQTWATIETFMDQNGISVYGAAPGGALEGEPDGYRPTDYVPGAKSVLAFGSPVSRGVYKSGKWSKELYWREAALFYRHMDLLSSQLAGLIEGTDQVAAMVPACFPFEIRTLADFVGYAGLVRMAEAVGLGKIGRNGLLMHEKYGPRLHLGGVITTVELPEICVGGSEGEACPEDCTVCVDVCPVDALDGSGRVDRAACGMKSSKAPLLVWALQNEVFGKADVNDVARVTAVDDHQLYECIACVAQCARL